MMEMGEEKRRNYWLSSVKNIVWGLVLTGITLNFYQLQYILPAVGVVLLLLGFKTLTRKDAWFNLGYYICILIAALFFVRTVYQAGIFSRIMGNWPLIVINAFRTIIFIAMFFCLGQGMKALQRKNGQEKVSAGPVVGLATVYLLTFAAGIFFEQVDVESALLRSIAAGLLLIAYIVCLRKLWKLAVAMNAAGTRVRRVPSLGHNFLVAGGYLVALLCCVLLCLRFCAAFPMDWTEESVNYQTEHEENMENLLALGFPEEALADISEDDLLLLKDAVRVESQWKYQVAESSVKDESVSKLMGRTIAVEVPSAQEEGVRGWVILFHFIWEGEPKYRFADSVEMRPLWTNAAYRDRFSAGEELLVSGRLLHDKEDVSYSAPYFSLGTEDYSDEEYIFDDLYGLFSFPEDGEHLRGYMLYYMEDAGEDYVESMELMTHYVYKSNWLVYPMAIGSDVKMYNDGNNEGFMHQYFSYLLEIRNE